MSHIAIQEMLDGKNVEWLEPVTDEHYGHSPSPSYVDQACCSASSCSAGANLPSSRCPAQPL
jgi:hypothetical protein